MQRIAPAALEQKPPVGLLENGNNNSTTELVVAQKQRPRPAIVEKLLASRAFTEESTAEDQNDILMKKEPVELSDVDRIKAAVSSYDPVMDDTSEREKEKSMREVSIHICLAGVNGYFAPKRLMALLRYS